MDDKISILIIESTKDILSHIKKALSIDKYLLEIVPNVMEANTYLSSISRSFDIILIGTDKHSVPNKQINEFIKEHEKDYRFVFLLPENSETKTIEALHFNSKGIVIKTTEILNKLAAKINKVYALYKKEHEILKPDAYLQSIFESGTDSIWAVDKDLNLTAFNKNFLDELKQNHNTTVKLQDNIIDIYSVTDKEFWVSKYSAALLGNRQIFEFKEGIQYYEIRLNPIFIGRRVIGVSAICRNITIRKSNEIRLYEQYQELERLNEELYYSKEKAEKNERYFKNIIEKSPLPIMILDENHELEFLNDKFSELFGYTLNDFETNDLWWYFAFPEEEYRKKVQKDLGKKVKEPYKWQKKTKEWELTIKDGSDRICEFHIVGLGNKNLAVIKDITEQKKNYNKLIEAKEKAEENETLFNAFMKYAPMYAYIENENFAQIYRNHKIWNLFKVKDYNPFGSNELFDEVQSLELEKSSKNILSNTSKIEEKEFKTNFNQMLDNDIWIRDIKFPIKLPNKKTLVGGVAIDISQEKITEEKLIKHQQELEKKINERTKDLTLSNLELKKSNDKLIKKKVELEKTLYELHKTQTQLLQSEKMASLGILVTGIAHEINNPINFINSSISGLKNNVEYLLEFAEVFQNLTEAPELTNKKLKELQNEISVTELLEMQKKSIDIITIGISRTTKIIRSLKSFARTDEKEYSKYDLNENINSTLLILQHLYKNKISIEKKYGELPPINCFGGKINQVLMNLLVNAIQAIEDEGKITISTKKSNNNVLITISDTGKGIAPKDLNHIFDPFFTTKKEQDGTGLGLAITYNIIKEHKGNIFVDSTPGKGTSFKIVLPINYKTELSYGI